MDDLADKDCSRYKTESEYFRYKQNWWITLNKSGSTGPLRNRSDFNEALSTMNHIYTKNLENDYSGRCPTGSTRKGTHHRVLPPVGGNGVDPGGLHNSKKVDE